MFAYWNNYYYLFLVVQVVCIIHALRTGRREWIYLLIFLPFVGAIAYLIVEVLPEVRRGDFLSNMQGVFFPKARIRDRERRLRVSDSVTNRLNLADAYAEQGRFGDAIPLVKSCMTDLYASDPDLLLRLARLYFHNGQFSESVECFSKGLYPESKGLNRMEDEILYARALEGSGNKEAAELLYQKTIRRHHSLEARYWYGLLLKQDGRLQEARDQFKTIREDIDLHPKYSRRRYATWARRARRELRTL